MKILKQYFSRVAAATVVVSVGFFVLGAAAVPKAALAANCSAGSLIKGSAAAVYYCGNDGLRYVFPNAQTYKTWYANFSGVQTLADSLIASIPLGGNITYKPGARLVKIQSMPKVYAVAQGGVLRWVSTEAAAIALYGAGWNQQVDDLPDWAWVDYGVGQNIVSASDFSPAAASNNALIATNVFTHGAGSSTAAVGASASVTLSLSPSVLSLSSGQSTTATITAYDPAGITTLKIYVNGAVVQSCSGGGATGLSCAANIYGSNYSSYPSISIYGQETNVNGASANSSSTSLSISAAAGSVALSLSPSASSLAQGSTTTITANGADTVAGLSALYIYVNGSIVQTCGNLNGVSSVTCTYVLYGANYAAGSTVSISATQINKSGVSASSGTSNLAIVASGTASSSSVTLSFSPSSGSLAQGQSMNVMANAADATSGLSAIYVYLNGSLVQTCNGLNGVAAATCSFTIYGSSYAAGANLSFYATALNRNGQSSTSAPASVTIGSSTAASGTGSVTVALSPYAASLPRNQSTNATVLVNDSAGISTINVYANGSIIQTCNGLGGVSAASCTATLYGINYASGSSVAIYGQAISTAGATSTSSTSNIVVN